MKLIKSWLIPIIIAILLFIVVQPTLAQLGEQQESLVDYLASKNVEVGEEVVNGFLQIYYLYNGAKTYVSPEGQNSKQPSTNGAYIVWVTEKNDVPGQIFLFNILTSTSAIQISNSGTNLNPKVNREGKVVWEEWVENRWQISLFDGTSVQQLTSGDESFNPEIEGDIVSYTRRDIAGTYRAVVYSISKKEGKEVTTGDSAKHPKVRNGKILLADGLEEFPLTVEDLFVLDLAPLSAPSEVTVTDIARELEATSSAQIESELTPTPSDVPGAETPTP